ncbi:MAG TPA: DoxX family protein [Chitinophagales bacterium]|nr:DoxX family protein [Chitinophagales bacterium]
MKKTKIIYWIFTAPFAAFMLSTAVPDALSTKEATDFMIKLGYPAYIVPFLGVAKILGVIAILIPGFPRIKEWAYAGLAFDLIGAMYSGIAMSDHSYGWTFMLLPLIFLTGSYVFYHKKLSAVSREEAVSLVM